MFVCMYAFTHAWMYVCQYIMYTCLFVCMYECMYACMTLRAIRQSAQYSFLGGGGGFIPATDAGVKDPSFPSLGREWGLADSIAQLSYACLMAFKIHAHHSCGISWVLPIVSDIGQ